MKDCFAYQSTHQCTVLKVKECKDCKFYKTWEKYKADELRAKEKYVNKTGIKNI